MIEHTISSDDFDVSRVSKLKHQFDKHPELTIDALRQLALRMSARDEGHVKFIDPQATLESDFVLNTESYDGRSIDDVFNSLETPGTWIAIYQAQDDPDFRTVVEEVITSANELLRGSEAKILDADAYIFISKAPSLTPFHIDRENNFLLQIRGKKHMSVWNPDDRRAVSEPGVENWIVKQSLAGVTFEQEKLSHTAIDENIVAGEGIFMPSTSAHMTRTEESSTEDPVSVTIGFVFYTTVTRRTANIYAFNAVVRYLGLTPSAPGQSALVDRIKYPIGFCMIRLLDFLGIIERPRGF